MKNARFSLAAAGIVVGLCVGTLAQAQTVRMGAGQQGSQNYGVNAALAQALEERTGLSFTVQSFGGPTSYLPLLEEGQIDAAAIVMPDFGDAIRGKGPFEGMQLSKLRLLVPLFPSPVGIMVAGKSGIDSLDDLAGKRIASGFSAQASLAPYVDGALANGGLSADSVKMVPVTSVANGVDELVTGRVDGTLFALRGGKVVEADSALGGIRWLPFKDTPEAVAAMQAVAPESYLIDVEPGNALGVSAPMKTMAYDYALVVGAHVPDETVEKIVRALVEKSDEIRASNKILTDLDAGAFGRTYPGVQRHPAAEKVLGSK